MIFAGEFVGVALLLLFLMDVEMDDGFESGEAVGSADEEGGELLFADFDEVGGVGAVVTADDEEDVEGLLEEFEEGVLALLGGTADGVEDLEVGGADRGAVAIEDGLLEAALPRQNLQEASKRVRKAARSPPWRM